jgi:hypothetical protein
VQSLAAFLRVGVRHQAEQDGEQDQRRTESAEGQTALGGRLGEEITGGAPIGELRAA